MQTKMAFKMMENVNSFLKAAKNYGLQSQFTPDDLVNRKNMNQVFAALRELADVVSLLHFVHIETLYSQAKGKGFQPELQPLKNSELQQHELHASANSARARSRNRRSLLIAESMRKSVMEQAAKEAQKEAKKDAPEAEKKQQPAAVGRTSSKSVEKEAENLKTAEKEAKKKEAKEKEGGEEKTKQAEVESGVTSTAKGDKEKKSKRERKESKATLKEKKEKKEKRERKDGDLTPMEEKDKKEKEGSSSKRESVVSSGESEASQIKQRVFSSASLHEITKDATNRKRTDTKSEIKEQTKEATPQSQSTNLTEAKEGHQRKESTSKSDSPKVSLNIEPKSLSISSKEEVVTTPRIRTESTVIPMPVKKDGCILEALGKSLSIRDTYVDSLDKKDNLTPLDMLAKAFSEILTTEESYLKHLDIMLKVRISVDQ